jgi:cell division protein FtsB
MLKSISGRSLAFATVLLVLAITLAPPLHSFFAQRAQIDAYKAQLAASQATLLEAEKELTQWSDPNYIASQARIRLHYVYPGEREYVVLTNTSQAAAKTVPVAPIEGVAPGGIPWYSRLLTTITSTGQN